MVKEYYEEIKNNLPDGVWKDEPDYMHWVDEDTKLDCLIVRQPNSGHLCGYVGVPKDHPWYKVDYSECSLPTSKSLDKRQQGRKIRKMARFNQTHFKYDRKKALQTAKWILNFNRNKRICSKDYCEHSPESNISVHGGLTYSRECNGHICHKTDNGDHVWWFGFDCAHSGDKSMFTREYERINMSSLSQGVYRDVDYVMNECKSLATQLKQYESKNTELSIKPS